MWRGIGEQVRAILRRPLGTDDTIDDNGIDQRTVGREPHYNIGRCACRGTHIPTQDVLLTPAKYSDTVAMRDAYQLIVARQSGGGNDDAVERARSLDALEHQIEQRAAEDPSERLAW